MSKITYATKVVQHGDVRSEELNEPVSAATIAKMPPPPPVLRPTVASSSAAQSRRHPGRQTE